MCDLFTKFDQSGIVHYADDNTLYTNWLDDTPVGVIKALETFSEKLFKWLSSNQMKGYFRKCHLLMSTKKTEPKGIGENKIQSSKSLKTSCDEK